MKTKKQYWKSQYELAIWGLLMLGGFLGWIDYNKNYEISDFSKIVLAVPVVMALLESMWWAIKHHVNKGIRFAYLHSVILKRLEKDFTNAGIYVRKYEGKNNLIDLPPISVSIKDDKRSGVIIVKNCVRLTQKLDELPISSALPNNYVIVRAYLSDNQNEYIYEFENAKIEQLYFSSFEKFQLYNKKIDEYKLFMDEKHCVQMHHHLLVAQTGDGKSYAIMGYILQMLSKSKPWEIYIADPKFSGIYALGKMINSDRTAYQTEDIINLLRLFSDRMEKRKEECQKFIKKDINGTYKEFGLTPIVLIIDEFSAFRSAINKYEKRTRDEVDSIISSIVLMGRAIGVFLIISQQQTNAHNLPTELRENIPWKVILGNAERQTYMTAFGELPENAKRKFEKGQGLLVYPQIATADCPAVVSMPTIGFKIEEGVKRLLD